MKLQKLRNYRNSSNILAGIFYKNPLIVLGLGVSFAVGAATSLQHSLAITIAIYATLIPTALISSLMPKYLPSYVKNIMLALISAIGLLLASFPIGSISPTIFDSLGIYFPLLALNSLVVSKYIQHGVVGNHSIAIVDAMKTATGYSLALLLIGALREYIGSGTIMGVATNSPIILPATLLPFAGFIITGFCVAFFRVLERLIRAKIYRDSRKEEVK